MFTLSRVGGGLSVLAVVVAGWALVVETVVSVLRAM
jgi:hypothetical protein